MSSNTVAEFANELKKSPEILLDQLKAAGVGKSSAADPLTESDKQKLLAHLQASHGTASTDRKKITLVKKSTSEIKQADASGKARTIQVEIRKKRTFIKREDEPELGTPDESLSDEARADAAHEADLSRREEEARRQAELISRQEEELVQKRQEREERERREREAEERAAAYAAQEAQRKAQASAAKEEASREQAAEAAARAAAQTAAREKAEAEAKARAAEEAARALDIVRERSEKWAEEDAEEDR